MAKTIWQYPVKYVYGYSRAYGSGFHTGEDRTVTDGRTDIQVTVNGRLIGIAGTTGRSTGIHTHIGKWLGNGNYNPRGGGRVFKSAVVTEIHPKSTNGNGIYVRVQGDNYSWVYLHLKSVASGLKVGQKLVAPPPPKPPAPTYPRWVKVNTARGANVRSAPRTSAPRAGSKYLPFGTPFRVAGVVTGENINGNNKWYKSMYGNYVWTGNVS